MFKKFILKNDESEVESYEFKKFGLRVTPAAENYEEKILVEKKPFEICKNSSNRSGVSYLKEQRIETAINEQVAKNLEDEKVKIFEEYKEKGFQEGFKEALSAGQEELLAEYKDKIEQSYKIINKLSQELESFKGNLFSEVELDLKKLVKLYAEKICLKEIAINENHLEDTVKSLINEYPNLNQLNIRISPSDKEQLNTVLSKINSSQLSKNIQFTEDEALQTGCLVLQTPTGTVDLSIEERFERVWKSIE